MKTICVNKLLEIQNANGMLAKQAVLAKYSDDVEFRKLLNCLLNPAYVYNVSEASFKSKPHQELVGSVDFFADFFECCDFLASRRGVDSETVQLVTDHLDMNYSEADAAILKKILAKTLRLGITAKTVNKVIPGLIPEWEVQQAYPLEKYPLKDGEEFWVTQKLNGVRATFRNGRFIGRSGAPLQGLDHIAREISWLQFNGTGIVLDGELTLADTNGLSENEAFRIATGIINSDAENKTTIQYTIFDAIPAPDFDSEAPQLVYADRRRILDLLQSPLEGANFAHILPVLYHGTDQSKISELLDQMVREDKEGLMINTNVPYKRTRHRGILKVKRFYTMDLPVIGAEQGTGRLKDTLGALVVDFQGNQVRVGSGFTDEQRRDFWEHREYIVGNNLLCEVKYKEISDDKTTGLKSLQFPVFVALRTDKTEPSYG